MSWTAVVAADEELGIGKDNDLPWHVPADLKHFKETTTAAPPGVRNVVFMGRKTWDSVEPKYRPLSGRINVVLSRSAIHVPSGVVVVPSLAAASEWFDAQGDEVGMFFIVGGGNVYQQCIDGGLCDTVILTRIAGVHQCDAFFPDITAAFQRTEVLSEGESNETHYRIEEWVRK